MQTIPKHLNNEKSFHEILNKKHEIENTRVYAFATKNIFGIRTMKTSRI